MTANPSNAPAIPGSATHSGHVHSLFPIVKADVMLRRFFLALSSLAMLLLAPESPK
jgi:hypothetical protein